MYTSSSPHLGTACGHAHRSRSALASSIVPSIVQWMLKAVMLMAASGFSHKSTPLRTLLARSSRRATSFLGKFANILAAYLQIRSLELCSYYPGWQQKRPRQQLRRFRRGFTMFSHTCSRRALWLCGGQTVGDWSLSAAAPGMTRETCCFHARGAGAQSARCDGPRPFGAHRALVLWFPW